MFGFLTSGFKRWRSPNFNDRRGGAPSMIILHYTGMKTARDALVRLCDPKSEVSAHYLIEESGKAHALVHEGKRAWHAGLSHWRGETDINSHSIGVEIVNPGHEFGYESFSDTQINAVIRICTQAIEKHKIRPDMVLGHSDVAPSRKQDPGEKFPWQKLAAKGIGTWPTLRDDDFVAADDIAGEGKEPDIQTIHQLLKDYGYDPNVAFETVLAAFHRHFYPEKFDQGQDPAMPDRLTVARLYALLREKS